MKKIVNFSLTLDLSEIGLGVNVQQKNYTGYKLSLYENGILTKSTYLNVEQWEAFKNLCTISEADTFFLGNERNYMNGSQCNAYGKMILKNCRFYTRPLSSDEIKLNYDTRLAYDEDNDE